MVGYAYLSCLLNTYKYNFTGTIVSAGAVTAITTAVFELYACHCVTLMLFVVCCFIIPWWFRSLILMWFMNHFLMDDPLPYLTFGMGRLLHLPSAEAISFRPNAQPRCNHKVTVIGCEAEIGYEAEKSPATWDWWRVVWLFLSCGLLLVSSSPSD